MRQVDVQLRSGCWQRAWRHHPRASRRAQARPERRRGRARSAPGSRRSSSTRTTSTPRFIRMPLAAGDEKYGRLEGARLKQFVNEITAISRKSRDDGELLWGRIAGTKYDDMTEALVESKFKEFGLRTSGASTSTCRRSGSRPAGRSAPAAAARRVTFKTLQAGARRRPPTPTGGLDLDVGLGRPRRGSRLRRPRRQGQAGGDPQLPDAERRRPLGRLERRHAPGGREGRGRRSSSTSPFPATCSDRDERRPRACRRSRSAPTT